MSYWPDSPVDENDSKKPLEVPPTLEKGAVNKAHMTGDRALPPHSNAIATFLSTI